MGRVISIEEDSDLIIELHDILSLNRISQAYSEDELSIKLSEIFLKHGLEPISLKSLYDLIDCLKSEILDEIIEEDDFNEQIIELPILIPAIDNSEMRITEVNKRLDLIRHYNNSVLTFSGDKDKIELPTIDNGEFIQNEELYGNLIRYQVNDFDRAEASCGFILSDKELCKEYLTKNNKNCPNEESDSQKDESAIYFHMAMGREIKRHSYLKIRAKLALMEIAFIQTNNTEIFLDLISLTPLYLRSSIVHEEVLKSRLVKKTDKSSNDFLSRLFEELTIDGRGKVRRIEYFKLFNFYEMLVGCVDDNSNYDFNVKNFSNENEACFHFMSAFSQFKFGKENLTKLIKAIYLEPNKHRLHFSTFLVEEFEYGQGSFFNNVVPFVRKIKELNMNRLHEEGEYLHFSLEEMFDSLSSEKNGLYKYDFYSEIDKSLF